QDPLLRLDRCLAHVSHPVVGVGWLAHLCENRAHHALEQLVLVAEPVIQRHGLDAELACEGARGHTVEALLVGHGDRRRDHTITTERFTPNRLPLDNLTLYAYAF